MTAKKRKRRGASDDDLPEFERPPLAEVVLGIQFDPLVGMAAAHLGAIWGLFHDRFPRTEDRQPLAPVFERFDSPSEMTAVEWNLDLVQRPPLPRCWFINDTGDELLQLQEDRFLHNWRKIGPQQTYPRYSKLRKSFAGEAASLERFVAREGIGKLKPNQCEVTYINHIVADGNWREHPEAGKLFRLLADTEKVKLWAVPEHVRFDTAFLMKDAGDEPRGRLHVSIVSGFLKEGSKPMFAMTLSARGTPIDEGLDGTLKFLDLGHRWIVHGFEELTTEPMHAAWGRKTR